jgi:prepilin-type N-terminal cleavage/methylation domain-containing protein
MISGSLRQRGFTVFELMMTVAITSIVLTLGMPSMVSAIEKRRTVAAAERVYGQLQLARLQSVAQSEQVFAEFWFSDPDWGMGVTDDMAICDPEDNAPACTVRDVDGANGVTYWMSGADFDNITVESSANITFSPQRATATAATIDVSSTGKIGYLMRVEVGLLGQISLCSPNGDPAKFVGGYRPC